MKDNSIVFALDDYPDISLEDFDEWLVPKCFKVPAEYGLYKDKYDVVFELFKDWDNNRLVISAKLIDYDELQFDPALQEVLEDIHKKKKQLEPDGMAQHIVKHCDER